MIPTIRVISQKMRSIVLRCAVKIDVKFVKKMAQNVLLKVLKVFIPKNSCITQCILKINIWPDMNNMLYYEHIIQPTIWTK